jgi:hypothetical protein
MISNTAPVANGWGVTDIVTSVECDISRPGREVRKNPPLICLS